RGRQATASLRQAPRRESSGPRSHEVSSFVRDEGFASGCERLPEVPGGADRRTCELLGRALHIFWLTRYVLLDEAAAATVVDLHPPLAIREVDADAGTREALSPVAEAEISGGELVRQVAPSKRAVLERLRDAFAGERVDTSRFPNQHDVRRSIAAVRLVSTLSKALVPVVLDVQSTLR